LISTRRSRKIFAILPIPVICALAARKS